MLHLYSCRVLDPEVSLQSFITSSDFMCCSEESNKEKQDIHSETVYAGMRCKRQRISDVDMFCTDTAEQQHMSGDTVDNCIHSSEDIEVVPPSPLPLSKSTCIGNTSVLSGSSAARHPAACQQKRKAEEMDMLNDVEPDGSLSSACTETSELEQNSRGDVVATTVDSSPVIPSCLPSDGKYDQLIISERQKPSASSENSTLAQKVSHLQDSRAFAAASQSQSDDVACVNPESSIIAGNDNENICDLVTQSSTADQSFHSCTAADSQSSLVNVHLLMYLVVLTEHFDHKASFVRCGWLTLTRMLAHLQHYGHMMWPRGIEQHSDPLRLCDNDDDDDDDDDDYVMLYDEAVG